MQKLYFFYGREELLKRQAVDKIKEVLVPPSVESLNFTVLEGGKICAQDVINASETLPFMNGKRMVLIKGFNAGSAGRDRLSRDDVDALEEYFKNIPEYSCVVIVTAENPDMRTRIMKTIRNNGVAVEFGRLKPEHLVKWIKKQVEMRDKTIHTAQVKRFVEITGYLDRDGWKTLDDMTNEIDKLVEYCRVKKVIEEEDIQAIAPRNLKTNIFKLVDAIGRRDAALALCLLEDMKLAREPALRVFYMITRQFRLLLKVAFLKDAGYSAKGIASRLKLQPFIVSSLLKQRENFSLQDLRKALICCSRRDISIKSGKIEPWLSMELLITELGGESNKKSVL